MHLLIVLLLISPCFSVVYIGNMTYFTDPDSACGVALKNTEMVAASPDMFFEKFQPSGDYNPNHNKICGRYVNIWKVPSRKIRVRIYDRCGSCSNKGLQKDIDVRPAVFDKVYGKTKSYINVGRYAPIFWEFV